MYSFQPAVLILKIINVFIDVFHHIYIYIYALTLTQI